MAHSGLDLGQIYAPEKVLFLHDLDKKKCVCTAFPSLIYMKRGLCHLGFRVCSVRRVWYVTKGPSQQEEEVVEGEERAHLKGRRPSQPTERGVPTSWEGGLHIVFLLWAVVYNQKGSPSSGQARCCDLFLGAVCIPSSIQCLPDSPGSLHYQSLHLRPF
jgi:hypothetical protein